METETTTQQLIPTPATEWKGKVNLEGTDLELPSGNVARVKQITPLAFVSSGMIPDPLSGIINSAINEKSGLSPSQMKKISQSDTDLVAALEMFDRVLVFAVISPQIEMPPACSVVINDEPCGEYANTSVHKTPQKSGHHQYREGDRDPGILYADVVDMQDKMFIFNWCLGGTRDLTKFREEQTERMASVSDSEDVGQPAKRPARRK